MINSALIRNSSYTKINVIFAGIILCIFIYSGIFSSDGTSHPIPSGYTSITGEATNSSGMSRAFSAIVRLDFEKALSYNDESLKVFGFFFGQFFLRILFILVYANYRNNTIITADVVISVALFIYCFEGLFLLS
jgi:hypothetical protein